MWGQVFQVIRIPSIPSGSVDILKLIDVKLKLRGVLKLGFLNWGKLMRVTPLGKMGVKGSLSQIGKYEMSCEFVILDLVCSWGICCFVFGFVIKIYYHYYVIIIISINFYKYCC